MKTRELAEGLRKVASFLDSRDEFSLDGRGGMHISVYVDFEARLSFYDKEKFTEAAKVFGTAVKSVTEGEYPEFQLKSSSAPVKLSIQRDVVCKKTVMYACEPLFTPEEVEAL